MKTIGCNLERIEWAFVTHFHIDHAGLISSFIERGITCFVFENQVAAIDAMEMTIEKNDTSYRRIEKQKLVPITTHASRQVLKELGIEGQVIITDYHSSDSITFISDDGEAIIGDLPPVGQMMPDDRRFNETWRFIRDMGGTHIYPSHAEIFRFGEGA
jgi:glyoxylase-like metal-dependent hydrolase (beta-lactamase superfamily II)